MQVGVEHFARLQFLEVVTHFDVRNLLSTFYVIINHNLVIKYINRVDKRVNDALTEFLVCRVSVRKIFQPGFILVYGETLFR